MAKRGGKAASVVLSSPSQGYSSTAFKHQLRVPEARSILDSKLYKKAESALQELLTGKGKYSMDSEQRESQTRVKSQADSGNRKETVKSASQRRSISSRQEGEDVRSIHQARGRFLRSILNQTPMSLPTLPPKPSPVPNTTIEEKEAVAASLRNQLLQRFQTRDPEEPPQDLLHMTVLQRTEQFLRRRADRIKEQQQSLKVREVAECTFHPILYTQISPKDMNRPTKELLTLSFERSVKPLQRTRSQSRSKTSSYSELYQRSKATTPRRKSLSGTSHYLEG